MSKLALKIETLQTLTSTDLAGVAGGLGHIKNPYESHVGPHKPKQPDHHVSSKRRC